MVGLEKPWEQYGLFITSGAALVAAYKYAATSRAAFKAQLLPEGSPERRDLMARYLMTPQQVEFAPYWSRTLRLKGLAALTAPLLWIAWRSSMPEGTRA
ncbi:hypothetical protein TSOC_007271 [Tetrabaena socialis]|uniref:Uncharacterized protein n=1 Tax=Tetrabaena socialis TaxID=47790 RepID=A0A2J8A1F1_9CHLO|nr:hypothetical protein TSOC_007271 [Tetrabaena socialis]|eukprot:PNH06352.1 hypothetical protein TSOC_007271 [Tetrabaena socialis]